jgi:hypothetical protein
LLEILLRDYRKPLSPALASGLITLAEQLVCWFSTDSRCATLVVNVLARLQTAASQGLFSSASAITPKARTLVKLLLEVVGTCADRVLCLVVTLRALAC